MGAGRAAQQRLLVLCRKPDRELFERGGSPAAAALRRPRRFGFTGHRPRQTPRRRAGGLDCIGARPYGPAAATSQSQLVRRTRMSTDVKVPALGESITEATLGQWLKQPGDTVAADEPIASLETDKVSVEVNAPVAGTLAEQLVKEGDTVEVGAVIARVGEGGGAVAAAAPAQEAADASTNPPGPAETPLPRDNALAPTEEHADLTLSPAVRRAVLEHHVDPSKING